MKKVFFTCLIAIATLSSCIGPQGPRGPQGPAGVDGETTNWKIIPLTVNSGDWIEDSDNGNRYYTAYFSIPEISSFVYTDGIVFCYAVVNSSQIILPYVRHFQEATSSGTAFWTRTVDFDYGVGGVNIYVTNSDFVADVPPTMDFSLKLLW